MEELLAFFQTGNIVTTRHGGNEEWITNSILSADSNGMEISLKHEYVDNHITKGDSMEVRIAQEGYLCIAKGTVSDIVLAFPQRVRIKVASFDRVKDKREDARYDVHFRSMIRGVEIDSDEYSTVNNISRSGVGIVGPYNFAIGSEIFIDVFLEQGGPLKLKGTPIRKKAFGYNIEYGVSTQPIDEINKDILDRLIGELEHKLSGGMSVIKKIRANITAAE